MINAFRKLLRLERESQLPDAPVLHFPMQAVANSDPEILEDLVTPDIKEIEILEAASEKSEDQTDSPSRDSQNDWSNEMAEHCHDNHKKRYVCFNPPARARVGTYYEFDSYCCDDDMEQAAQDFYDFALMKKPANPAIEKVELAISPNGAARFVIIHWRFLELVPVILTDAEELWEKYLDLLGY